MLSYIEPIKEKGRGGVARHDARPSVFVHCSNEQRDGHNLYTSSASVRLRTMDSKLSKNSCSQLVARGIGSPVL